MAEDLYSFTVQNAKEMPQALSEFKGQVALIVNVASRCGFTGQYEGLEKIYQQFKEQGFVVLGFPSNQFGQQEPGTNEEIQKFCKLNYGVSFPVFAKVDVNGKHEAPIYQWLKKEKSGVLGTEAIKWNFTKFLVDRKGKVIKRYAPQTKPEDIAKDIEAALKEPKA